MIRFICVVLFRDLKVSLPLLNALFKLIPVWGPSDSCAALSCFHRRLPEILRLQITSPASRSMVQSIGRPTTAEYYVSVVRVCLPCLS